MEKLISGIVGVIKQNIGGSMSVEAEYYVRRKSLEKVMLNGKLFTVNRNAEYVDFFEGDRIRIERKRLVNLTFEESGTTLKKIFTQKEYEKFDNSLAPLSFMGIIEKVNYFGNVMAARIRVTRKRQEDKRKIDKSILVINYYPSAELNGMYRQTRCNLVKLSDDGEHKITLNKVFNHYHTHSIVAVITDTNSRNQADADNFTKRNC
ncbi:MAG: hypothetical protein IJ532_00955 [Alphaproteobacteria bacterium]|nr:hypothetical protein [Alphaproteobacteria bacterium]